MRRLLLAALLAGCGIDTAISGAVTRASFCEARPGSYTAELTLRTSAGCEPGKLLATSAGDSCRSEKIGVCSLSFSECYIQEPMIDAIKFSFTRVAANGDVLGTIVASDGGCEQVFDVLLRRATE